MSDHKTAEVLSATPLILTKSNSKKNLYNFHVAHLENVFITISGLIGAGKTTLAEALAKRLNLPIYYEPVKNNVYLEDFYKDIKKYSFPMQVYLLNARFKQQQEIIWGGKGGVQDRSIYEDSIFAKMLYESNLMEERDYETYQSLFRHMSNFMKVPSVIVHLDCSPEESLRRIKLRNRECESSISLDYLKNLHRGYEEFIRDISRTVPVIKVNYERFPTVDEMVEAIAEQYQNLSMIKHVLYDDAPSMVTSLSAPVPAPEAEVKTSQSSE